MDLTLLWTALAPGGVALLLGLIGLWFLTRVRARRVRLDPELRDALRKAPWTPLQRRAWWGLIIGVSVAAAILGLVLRQEPEAFLEDDGLRFALWGLLLAACVADILLLGGSRFAGGGVKVALDERDRRVLDRAPRVQSIAVLFVVAVWAIALTERYWDEGSIPIAYPMLILGSALVVHVVSLSLGILVGYWGAGHHGEG